MQFCMWFQLTVKVDIYRYYNLLGLYCSGPETNSSYLPNSVVYLLSTLILLLNQLSGEKTNLVSRIAQ